MRTEVLLILLLLSIALSGCAQEEPSEKTTQSPTSQVKVEDIPVYSGSEVYSAQSFFYQMMGIPLEGLSVHVYYLKEGSVKDILEWYKGKLSDYEMVQEIKLSSVTTPQGSMEWGGIIFRKGDRGVGIWAISGKSIESGKGVMYYIVTGPWDKLMGEEVATTTSKLPTSDQVAGDEPLKRYPGSVMLEYSFEEGFPSYYSIVYGTRDDAFAVENWYRNELQSGGWILKEADKSAEEIYMVLSKDSDEVEVTIIPPSQDTGYTEIYVYYSSSRLPSSDQASGEEPIKRYSTSVMLSYSSITYGGGKTIYITYGTTDDVNTVLNWYRTFLSKDWQIVAEQTYAETKTITAIKSDGNTVVTVTISAEDGYTEIEVQFQQTTG